MRPVALTPEKQTPEVKTRRIRCLHSRRSTALRPLPVIPIEGVWLRDAGFEVGDWARIIVLDGVLIIRSERPDELMWQEA